MRVLIQQKRGRFPDISYYVAALGFEELGHEVILTEETDLEHQDAGCEVMFVGEIEFMLAAFAWRGINYVPLSYIPSELLSFAGRKIWASTLGEVRNRVAAGQSLFAKPLEGTPRLFKGQILKLFRDLLRTAHCDPATPVWCSDLVDFISEYRVFVRASEIIGIKHYYGDFRTFVDFRVVDEVLARYQKPPAGFAIDFGVTSGGRTLIVEQNDGYSLGAYGLHPVSYAKLLEARWNEVVSCI